MPSIGAKLAATTAAGAAGFLLAACSGQEAPKTLQDASATRALIERSAERREQLPHEYAAAANDALRGGDPISAVELAEHAVALDSSHEEARTVLAKAYFGAGRFRSAAEAYTDLITMRPRDDRHRLGAVLANLADGDTRRARDLVEPLHTKVELSTDVGLAFVLLGDPERGIDLLENSVRQGISTARTRQNLALAQALAGRWNNARVTAAIDLHPKDVEARVAEWAALSVSKDPAARTAMLLKIEAAPMDAGRPAQLAYNAPKAAAVQHAAPNPKAAGPARAQARIETVSLPIAPGAALTPGTLPNVAVPKAKPSNLPLRLAAAETEVVSVPAPAPAPARLVRANELRVAARTPSFEARQHAAAEVGETEVAGAEAKTADMAAAAQADGAAALPESGEGAWLVQLGSYDRPEWVGENWQVLKTRNDFLAAYKPVRSKAEVDGRTYYRLSVGRFDTREDASAVCEAIKETGETCFLREGKFKT